MVMRKIAAALGGVVALVLSLAPSASAQTVQAAPNCQQGTSYGTYVASAPVSVVGGSTRMATIQLCRDSSYNYYGFVLFTTPLPVNQWGQAYIYRYRDGVYESTVSCDDGNGNGYVEPGQTRCWTPKFTGGSGHWSFQAEGQLWNSHSGNIVAVGTTAITR